MLNVLLLLFVAIYVVCVAKTTEGFLPFKPTPAIQSTLRRTPVKFKRCQGKLSEIEKNILDKFDRVKNDTWDVYVPCGYTYVENELKENNHFQSRGKKGWVLGIEGADNFAAKDRAWALLEKRYGRLRATIFMPETWLTYQPSQVANFRKHAASHPSDMYIMKKNIQQQKGLMIVVDPRNVDDAYAQGYVVVQRILRDPFTVNGRKINLRVYILVVCRQGRKSLYVYDDGFVYYSRVPYVKGETWDEIVTSGYISRDVYSNNPLTFKDLLKYIHENLGPAAVDRFVRQRNYILSGFMEAVKNDFCTIDNSNVVNAQSYGVDMQPNHNLTDVKILEINKGQSLEIMDTRDGNLKQKMMDDMFRTLGIINDDIPSGYVRIWTSGSNV